MVVNFSYRAIPNLTLDLYDGHFSKWLTEYASFNIWVLNSRRKKLLVSKHTFSGPRITKKNIKNTKKDALFDGGHFSKLPPVLYTCFNSWSLINMEIQS